MTSPWCAVGALQASSDCELSVRTGRCWCIGTGQISTSKRDSGDGAQYPESFHARHAAIQRDCRTLRPLPRKTIWKLSRCEAADTVEVARIRITLTRTYRTRRLWQLVPRVKGKCYRGRQQKPDNTWLQRTDRRLEDACCRECANTERSITSLQYPRRRCRRCRRC